MIKWKKDSELFKKTLLKQDTIPHGLAEFVEILKLITKERVLSTMLLTLSNHLDGQEPLLSLDVESTVAFILVMEPNVEVQATAQLTLQKFKVIQLI
jgi:hypothetical protein